MEGNSLRCHRYGWLRRSARVLRDETVDNLLVIGRNSIGQTHPKLRELRRPDMFDFGGVAVELQGYNACFFCLGARCCRLCEQLLWERL